MINEKREQRNEKPGNEMRNEERIKKWELRRNKRETKTNKQETINEKRETREKKRESRKKKLETLKAEEEVDNIIVETNLETEEKVIINIHK